MTEAKEIEIIRAKLAVEIITASIKGKPFDQDEFDKISKWAYETALTLTDKEKLKSKMWAPSLS